MIGKARYASVRGHEMYCWTVIIDDVRHEVAWWPQDGSLWLSFPRDSKHWSRFVEMGAAHSPRSDLAGASEAVRAWAAAQRARAVA